MLITSRQIDGAFRRGYEACVEEKRQCYNQIREAYEFYLLDSDKSMAAQIFAQQVGEILEAETW